MTALVKIVAVEQNAPLNHKYVLTADKLKLFLVDGRLGQKDVLLCKVLINIKSTCNSLRQQFKARVAIKVKKKETGYHPAYTDTVNVQTLMFARQRI